MKEIRIAAGNVSVINLVRKIEKFKEFSEQELHDFINSGRLREYEPNEIIMEEGGFDCWVYFLITGELRIEKENHAIGNLKRCGDIFGEMGVIDGSPRSATIVAQVKSLLLGFDASVIDQKLKANQTHFCYIIYRIFAEVLAARLRDTTDVNVRFNKEISALKNELGELKGNNS